MKIDFDWLEFALCRGTDPELFTALDGSRDQARALAICADCPVRSECLTGALAEGDDATVRGGLTPEDRRKLRRRAPVARAA
jgi:WhiB family redox-sensing transcriptional regulator